MSHFFRKVLAYMSMLLNPVRAFRIYRIVNQAKNAKINPTTKAIKYAMMLQAETFIGHDDTRLLVEAYKAGFLASVVFESYTSPSFSPIEYNAKAYDFALDAIKRRFGSPIQGNLRLLFHQAFRAGIEKK